MIPDFLKPENANHTSPLDDILLEIMTQYEKLFGLDFSNETLNFSDDKMINF